MKKINILFVFLLIICVTSLTACKKKQEEKKYDKETTVYSIDSANGFSRVSFELANDLGYNPVISTNNARFRHMGNYSLIDMTIIYNYPSSSQITKKEEDFYSDYYKDYKTVKIGNYEGWSVIKETETVTDYEIVLKLTSPDKNNRVYALDIRVAQSPLQKNKDDFNTRDFINSDDFNHLLNSIQIAEIYE